MAHTSSLLFPLGRSSSSLQRTHPTQRFFCNGLGIISALYERAYAYNVCSSVSIIYLVTVASPVAASCATGGEFKRCIDWRLTMLAADDWLSSFMLSKQSA